MGLLILIALFNYILSIVCYACGDSETGLSALYVAVFASGAVVFLADDYTS